MPENGISEFELSAWLLGALDPDRAEELAQAVARSPALAERASGSWSACPAYAPARCRSPGVTGGDSSWRAVFTPGISARTRSVRAFAPAIVWSCG